MLNQMRNIPWVKNDGVDLVPKVLVSTHPEEKSQAHLVGAKVLSAPAGAVKTVVYGVNDDTISDDNIISSCFAIQRLFSTFS